MQPAEPAKGRGNTLSGRLMLLLACMGAGALAGVVGSSVTGSELWFLAVPLCVALGWLFVSDPTACERREP